MASIPDFFMHLFKSGLQVATVRDYRSAIAAILQGFLDGSSLSTNETSVLARLNLKDRGIAQDGACERIA